jgi:acid phosphatase type 7
LRVSLIRRCSIYEPISRRQALGVFAAPLVAGIAGCRPDSLLSPDLGSATLSESVTLLGAGDQHATRGNAGHTGKMIADALARDPNAFAFNAGDLVYNGTHAEYQNQYEPLWGSFKQRTWFTMGNHDHQADPSGTAYWDYVGERGGQRGRGWYAVTLGAWRMYVLNSEQAKSEEQIVWLKADLAAHKQRHILAMWHTPMFASVCAHHGRTMTMPGALGVWWQILTDHGAELAISGHVHRFERYPRMLRTGAASPNGIRQFICGTGGVNLMGILRAHPLSQSRVVAKGVMKLVLRPDRYEWSFTDEAKVVRDKGTQMCRKSA